MKVFHALVCFIFLTLHNGNTGRVQAGVPELRGVEGGNIHVWCKFSHPGTRRFFCRENCGKKNNILIETTKDTDNKGRYSIKYVRNNVLSLSLLYVSIKQLKKSDTGLYTCYLADTWERNLSPQFYIHVTGATKTTKTTKTTTTTTTTTTSKSLSFSSETSTESSASNETYKHPEGSPDGSGAADPLPYVGLILAVMTVALLAALLIFCKRRRGHKPEGAPLETEYADITQANQLYEEIRHRDSSSPIEVSSACPKYSQPDENMDFYSLATAPQNTAEGNSNNLDYAEVDFSHVCSTNSAPCGNATDAIYTTPLVHARPANHIEDTSAPLYSTVGKYQ